MPDGRWVRAWSATARATVAEQFTVGRTKRWLRVPTRPSARWYPENVAADHDASGEPRHGAVSAAGP